MAVSRFVGARVKRIEDPKLIRGDGLYVDDLRLGGMLCAAFVRSPHAHARVTRVELKRARSAAGVVAALSAAELAEIQHPLPVTPAKGLRIVPHLPLAGDEVWYVGQPVAVVIADEAYRARDAAELVEVAYEPLPAAEDLDRAASGAPYAHTSHHTNVAYTNVVERGDVDAAFRDAPVVVRQRMVNQRVAPVSMETRGTAALYDGSQAQGILTVWTSTQEAHAVRDGLSAVLGLPVQRIRVITPDVGGGFGTKLNTYPEDAVVAHLARLLRRPVKWTASRRENLLTTAHGRDQVAYLEVAADRDGRIRGMRSRILANLGAACLQVTAIVPTLTQTMMQGPYAIPALRCELVEVYTNTTPTGAYRGAGRPEATYYLERAMELVADAAGVDPADVRRRNFISPDRFPYRAASGAEYDTGEYAKALDEALRVADYRGLRRAQVEARREGRLTGVGLSSYVEICGFGPWELGTVRANKDGTVIAITGTSPHGQGDATGFAQIVADILSIPIEQVAVVHGDTLLVEHGGGTSGSRTMYLGGAALQQAALAVREQILGVAADMLETASTDLVLADGRVSVRGAPARSVTVAEVAEAAYDGRHIPPGQDPGLEATSRFKSRGATFPFGTHVCVVELDPETCVARVVRYVAVDDCGRVINPLLVDGQVHGGIVQGASQALLEGVVYDEAGQLLTGTLTEYGAPRAAFMPRMERGISVTPTPRNPLGAKGVGEAATIGSTPAVVNAVVDALSHLGVRHLDMPMSPERIRAAIRAASPGTGGTASRSV